MGLILFGLPFACSAFGAAPDPRIAQCKKSGRHWVSAYPRPAYTKADGTHYSATKVSAHCQDNPPSYAVWNDRIKDRVLISRGGKSFRSNAWTTDERERVLEALSALPTALLATGRVKSLLRSKMDPIQEFSTAITDLSSGAITLFDAAFGKNRNLARVLGHEFAHALFRQSSDEEQADYAKTAGWMATKTPSGRIILVPRLDGYVEDDGADGLEEDFANNTEYFLFDRKSLLRKTPAVENWIHRKFGDKFKLGRALK